MNLSTRAAAIPTASSLQTIQEGLRDAVLVTQSRHGWLRGPGAFAHMDTGCQFHRQKEQGSRDFLHLQMHDFASEKHYSVIEISKLWALSQKTLRRIFENETGVIVWGCPETRRKRGYRTMRVPESVLQRVHRRLRQNL